jgi:hypothetical protein
MFYAAKTINNFFYNNHFKSTNIIISNPHTIAMNNNEIINSYYSLSTTLYI